MSLNTWITLAADPTVQSLLRSAASAIASQISPNLPLVRKDSEQPRLTDAGRRLSLGLTLREGKISVALLIEKPESSAERKAEGILASTANDLSDSATPIVTGIAYSAKVDEPIQSEDSRAIGASIGHIKGMPGSLGCLVRISSGTRDFLAVTSAAHVLSILNRAERGDPIILPGHPDGPCALDSKIGTLHNYTYLRHYKDDEKWANLVNTPPPERRWLQVTA